MSTKNDVPSVYNFLYQPVAAEGESEKPAEKFLLGFDNEKYYLHNNLDYSNAQISLYPGTSFTLKTPIINLKNSEDFYLELSSQSLSGNFKKVNITATENFLLKYNSSNAAMFEDEQGKRIVFGSYNDNVAIDACNSDNEKDNLSIGGNSKNIYIGSSNNSGAKGYLRIVNSDDSDGTNAGVYVNVKAEDEDNASWKKVVTETDINEINKKVDNQVVNKWVYYCKFTVVVATDVTWRFSGSFVSNTKRHNIENDKETKKELLPKIVSLAPNFYEEGKTTSSLGGVLRSHTWEDGGDKITLYFNKPDGTAGSKSFHYSQLGLEYQAGKLINPEL